MYGPRYSLLDLFRNHSLTNDQKEALKSLELFLRSPGENLFLLRGYAGTGKTFLIRGLIRYLQLRGRAFRLMAPTGKAARVIAQKSAQEAFTIHKSIYNTKAIREFEENSFNTTYKFYFELKPNTDPSNTVYIVDEASMISDKVQDNEFLRFGSGRVLHDLLHYINIDNNDQDKKIVFIGDNAQLPPVGMAFSPALQKSYLLEHFGLEAKECEMRQVVRQKEKSAIVRTAQNLRDALERESFVSLRLDPDEKEIVELTPKDIPRSYLQERNAIVIAYSNKMVKVYNDLIRESLGFSHEIEEGDRILCVKNGIYGGVFIANGDMGEVVKILRESEKRVVKLQNKNRKTGEISQRYVSLSFRDVILRFEQRETKVDVRCKIIENLLYSPDRTLNSDENKALYVDFKIRSKLHAKPEMLKKALLDDPYFNAMRIKFGYALTCHKAQGSEWERVYIDCENGSDKLNANYFRWLYTALTRSRQRVYLIHAPKIDILDRLEIPKTADFSKSVQQVSDIKELVRGVLSKKGISIISISHHNYHDIYYVGDGVWSGSIKIYYNKEGIVTKILSSGDDEIAEKITAFLEPKLIGYAILSEDQEERIDFSEMFQEEFYRSLLEKLSPHNIKITKVEHGHYYERYHFFSESRKAIVDFFYNAKGQFGHIHLHFSKSDKTLLYLLKSVLGKISKHS